MAQRKTKKNAARTRRPAADKRPGHAQRTTNARAKAAPGTGEAAGRRRGYEASGGEPGADLLEDGQLRGVDEEGNILTGTHGGPKKKPQRKSTGKPQRASRGSRAAERASAGR